MSRTSIRSRPSAERRSIRAVALLLTLLTSPLVWAGGRNAKRNVPEHIPPRRSSQIQEGPGGVNTSLPRDPYIPWNQWWWTRMFDAGIKWARIGQYEDTSDITGWDWIEQKRGQFAVPAGLDDYVDSLVDNGVKVQLQLLYGNPMYTAPAGRLPDSTIPTPATVHNRDLNLYSVFWPPKTPEQIAAFVRYTKWMVNHFRGRIHYYALWNEQDGTYWNPNADPEGYGRLLKAFTQAVHETDPEAKVIYGGQATLSRDFARTALDACQCAPGIDVFAYHTYPGGYATNVNPEAMDYGAFGAETPKTLREMVRNYSGIRPDIQFWDDEFNALPNLPKGSDESVQAKYVPRGMLYNWASGIPTFIWELINDTSSSEGDEFGMIHGMMHKPTDFVPRPVFNAVQSLDALFSDTKLDPSVEITGPEILEIQRVSMAPFLSFGFRSRAGKAIVAYWLAAHSWPNIAFVPYYATLTLKNTGIEHPVLINVLSGEISQLGWKAGTNDTLERLPVRDSIMAIADENYIDWPVLPEAPSSLNVSVSGNAAKLNWEVHGGNPTGISVERQLGERGTWERIAKLPASATAYTDSRLPRGQMASYRVRALNEAGESAYSNLVRINL